MKYFMRNIVRIFLLIIVFTAIIPIKSAYAETLEEYLNNLAGPKQQYSTMLSSAYLRNNESEISVNPQSGDMTINQTDYVLPGRNGLDLEIKRIYKSGVSNVHEMKAMWNGGAWVDYIQSDATTASFYENRYNIGVGWRFSFPTIEVRQNSDGSSFKYLHTESGDVYRLIGPTVINSVNTYTLENHTAKDLLIKEDTSYNNGQYQSKYVSTKKNGEKTYFDGNGRILSIIDRYGNAIRFEYSDISYTIEGYTRTRTLITKITDSVGKIVNIEYKEDQNFQLTSNTDGSKSSDLQKKFQVIIYLPDSTPNDLSNNKKIIYDKSGVLYSALFYSIRERLQRVYDTDDKVKYEFSVEQPYLGFTYTNGSSYSINNRYENIDSINYCKSNKFIRLFYGTYTKGLSSGGSMQYRRVIETQELAKKGLDASKTTYFDQLICDLKNKVTYTYTNEPDGYGYAGYSSNDQSYLKNTYRYYSEVTDMRGAKKKYTYDGLGETVNVDNYGNDHKEATTITYDVNKLPQRNEKLIYNVVNGQASGTPIKEVEEFVYDTYGNLTQYSGASGRDANGSLIGSSYTTPEGTIVNEHTVVYTYATDRYHVLTSKTWKKDSSATSRIEYTVDTTGNVIQEKKFHTESGSDKSVITNYEYDSHGNITKKILHYSDNTANTYVTNYEYGIDADGTDQKGAYLTKEYSIVDNTEVSTKYAYDFYTGNKKADIDAKLNRTSYSYDSVERLTNVTYPDNTMNKYSYYDDYYHNSEITYCNQLNHNFDYTYDIYGNLVKYGTSIIVNNQWQYSTIMQIQYDSNNNIIKELDAKGHSTRYDYDSANRLIKKSFWENDTTPKKSMSLAYTISYDSSTPLLLTVTDEEEYIKKYHYDILSRLVSIDTTPDKTNFYNTAYTYDYVGNKTSVKDGRNNTTNYTYDDLNRLVKQEDPLLNPTTYFYDAGNNLIQQINAKGISTYCEYDQLGRLIREKVPATDGSYAITRYVYDIKGNIIKGITPNYYDPAKDTPALVNSMAGLSYTYNNMDRPTAILSPEGNIIEYRTYYAGGNVKKVVDGLRYTGNVDTSSGTTYYYDVLGRVTQVNDAAGGIKYYEYDAVGKLTKKTDARTNQTLYTYNPDRTLAKVTYPDTGYIEYTYDRLGHMLTKKDQVGNVTTFIYDGFGHVLSEKDPYNYTIVNQYDQNGNLTNIKDKRDNYTYFTYDVNNKLEHKKVSLELDGNGNIGYAMEDYKYDVLGNVTMKSLTGTKDSSSIRNINYTYYDNNMVKTISDDNGGYTKNYYDKNGNIIKVETLRSSGVYDVAKCEYDNRDRLVKSIKLVEESSIYNAVSLPNISSIRDSNYPGMVQLITGYEYNILGNKTKVIEPRAYGYLASDIVNREIHSTKYSYDILNRLEKVTWKYNGAEVYKQYYYDANGNRIKERNEKGYFTEYTYDSLNRLKTITDALTHTTTYNYDLAGNRITEINAKEDSISYSYDKLNRLEMVTDPYQVVILKNIYDANGNIIKKIDAKGYLSGNTDDTRYGTIYVYDLANRLTKLVDPEIAALNDTSKYTFKYEYNQYSQRVKSTNALGYATQYQYDNAGRLTNVIDALIITTQYTYDNAGNMLTMIDGRGKVTRKSYGSFGNLLEVIDAENTVTTNKYDLALNNTQIVDGNGNEKIYTYDVRNLLLSKNVIQTGDMISYTYDEVGNRASMTDSTGLSVYGYNVINKLTSIKKDGVLQLSYMYDLLGNVSEVTDKKAFVTSYIYDKSSRMKTVSYIVSGATRTITYNYDQNGNRSEILYDGGIKEEYTYDKNNRLIKLFNRKPNGSIISSFSYIYDLAGNQTCKTTDYGSTNYTYDSDGRIHKVEMNGITTVYDYDNAGNRRSLSETYTSNQGSGYNDKESGMEIQYIVKNSEYIYSDANMLIELVEHMIDSTGKEVLVKSINYWYDYNGNLTYQSSEYKRPIHFDLQKELNISSYDDTTTIFDSSIESEEYSYDGFDRLIKVETIKNGSRTLTEFTYDGTDLRVKKTVKKSSTGYSAEVTNYLYDRQNVILETDAADKLKARYIKGINYIARIDAANKHSYFMFNGHGDVVQTVSADGTVENQYDYDIFGTPILTVEQYDCAIRYAGEFYDSETGLYYLRARYYDSMTARFITEDTYTGQPNDPLSLNLYTYCANNPVIYTDPTGHVIDKGDSGKKVTSLQTELQQLGYYSGKLDGKFGPKTEAAVKAFQKDNGLKVDGIVGSKTTSALGQVGSAYSASIAYGASSKVSNSVNTNKNTPTPTSKTTNTTMGNTNSNTTQNKETGKGNNVVATIRAATPEETAANENNKSDTYYINGTEAYLLGLACGITGMNIPKDSLNGYSDNYKAGKGTIFGLSIIGVFAAERLAVEGAAVVEEAAVVEGASQTDILGESHNVVNYAKYKEVLRTTEAANPLVESLRTSGELPSNYVTKAEAIAEGWKPGKALNNYVPGGQIGGDVFQNTTGILPDTIGRVWYEADVGLSSSISRAKQAGTRLVYSNDGLMYVTYDHYKTVNSIGTWK